VTVLVQSTKWRASCSDCESCALHHGGQAIVHGVLRWDVEVECTECGRLLHTGGPGEAPEELRQALLTEHGAATLRVTSEPLGTVNSLKAARDTFDVPLSDVRAVLEQLRSNGLTGTFIEMKFLAIKLEAAGMETTIPEPSTPPGATGHGEHLRTR
jgi:hypothetical protein